MQYKIAYNTVKIAYNAYLSETRLTALIREIFREEFEKQKENLLNLVTGNLEITMKEIKCTKTEMNSFKKSMEFTDNYLERRFQMDPEYVPNKFINLEDCSRRNNFRVDGFRKQTEKVRRIVKLR